MSEFSNYEKLINSEMFKNASGDFLVPFGELPNGDVLIQDMKKIPHMLVSGVVGCGKTSFVQAIILALMEKHTPAEVKFGIFDSKSVDYKPFTESEHLFIPVQNNEKNASGMLAFLTVEISKRERELSENVSADNPPKYPELFAVLDDCSNVIINEDNQDYLKKILDHGRAVGVHLILVTSAPTRTVVNQYIMAMTRTKVSFYQPSESMSRRAIGDAGAEKLDVGEIIVAEYSNRKKCKAFTIEFNEIKPKLEAITKDYYENHQDEIKKAEEETLKVLAKIAERYRQESKSVPQIGLLYIERKKRDSNPRKKIQVFVDGEYTEELDQGDVIEVELSFGEHEILLLVSTLFREYTRTIKVSLTKEDSKASYESYISNDGKICVTTSMRRFFKDPLKN